jgi:hypothetical protein
MASGLSRGGRDGLAADAAKVVSNLVGEHFYQSQSKKVWGVAAVGARKYITAEPGGAARTSVATCTAIAQSGCDRRVDFDIAYAVTRAWAESLSERKLTLKKLATSSD